MFNPSHVDETGKLVVTAISLQDLRSKGFSVNRMKYVSAEFVLRAIEERLSRKGGAWKDEGVAKFGAEDVRNIFVNGERALVIIDTALADNPGHASLYATHPNKGDAHARKLRSLLLPLLQNRMSVEEAFADMAV